MIKPNHVTSRISGFGRLIKKAAPIIGEKLQPRWGAWRASLLGYCWLSSRCNVSWTTTVVSESYASACAH